MIGRLIAAGLMCAGYLLAQAVDLVSSLERALTTSNSAEVAKLQSELLGARFSEEELLAAGGLLGQHDRLPDAARIFERCAELYPASFEAKYDLALTRIGLTDYPGALAALNQLRPASEEQRAATAYLTGKVFLDTNHLKEAQAKLAEANALRPGEENYALDLGLLYVRSAAYEPAVQVLRRALRAHPESAELRLELALAYALAGSNEEAIALCRQLEKQQAENSLSQVIAAFSYCAKGDFEGCEREAAAGLNGAHPHPYLYYLRARARWDSGERQPLASLDDLTRAIAAMPNCGACLLLRSRVYEVEHDDARALADGKRAAEINPDSAATWYRLSILERKAGDTGGAAKALQRYRAIQNDKATEEAESFRAQFLK